MSVWFKVVLATVLLALGCGDDEPGPPGGSSKAGRAGSGGIHAGGKDQGASGVGASGRSGGRAGNGAEAGQNAGRSSGTGGSGASSGEGDGGGPASDGGAMSGAGRASSGGLGASGGSTAQGGEAGMEDGGEAGMTAAGVGGGAGSGAGSGASAGSGGTGGSEPAPVECVLDSDCDAARGVSPCGTWHCTEDGRCQAESPGCSDADGDGYGAGESCACAALDCDDDDADVFDRARETCSLATGPHGGCFATVRLCHAGAWGECKPVPGEQIPGGEACNGEDDDCDGEVDEGLGDVSCGYGVCRRSVRACRGGSLQRCVPGTPTAVTDGCNGIDDDCDGSTDEDCGECVHVAPDGDDTAAAASSGSTPFLNLQPAIDFVAVNPSAPRLVCVASGPACNANAAFPGPDAADLTVKDGISVLGRYESTTWTRCAGSTTRLQPQTATGVSFPASVTTGAVLDGFTIERFAATTTAGITVDGAQGVVIASVTIDTGPASTTSYGVNVVAGGDARIVRSRITGGAGTTLAVGVRASGARVVLADNCRDLDPVTGRCDDDCASGPSIQGRNTAQYFDSYAITLDDAPGSRVETSAVCAQGSGDNEGTGLQTHVGAVTIAGSGKDVVIARCNLIATTQQGQPLRAVASDGCAGEKPWIVDNHSILAQSRFIGGSALRFAGDCHPVIDQNREIAAIYDRYNLGDTFAMACATAGSVASRCVISGNADVHAAGDPSPPMSSTFSDRGGILCDGACAKVVGNRVTARTRDPRAESRCTSSCSITGRGLVLDESGAFVDRNVITLGCTGTGAGLEAIDSWSRIQNTVAAGRTDPSCALSYSADRGLLLEIRGDENEVDAHSNSFSGIDNDALVSCGGPGFTGTAVTVSDLSPPPSGRRGILRNNTLSHACIGANLVAGFSRIFQSNAFFPSTGGYCPYSGYSGPGDAASCVAWINGFTDTVSSGNFLGDEFTEVYDAGTSEGAPLWDLYGNPRDETPDVGAWEHQ